MAAVAAPPPGAHLFAQDGPEGMSTLSDPRSPSPSTPLSRSDSAASSGQHPDLQHEIAMLSTKLVNAINYQTNLDDQLHSTREELERARRQIRALEEEKRKRADEVAAGLLVPKAEVDRIRAQLRKELDEAWQARISTEREREKAAVILAILPQSSYIGCCRFSLASFN